MFVLLTGHLLLASTSAPVMHIITRRTLLEAATKHAQVREELNTWYYRVKYAEWSDFNDLKQDMPATDLVRGSDSRFIFNIKGNHYRLLAVVRFQQKRVYIRGVFTHAEYSKLTTKDLLTM